MFYAAEALLHAKGLTFTKHGTLIAAFGEHFVKTNELDPRFHRAFIKAFDKRQVGDYVAISGLTQRDAEDLKRDARAFLDAAKAWLQNHPME